MSWNTSINGYTVPLPLPFLNVRSLERSLSLSLVCSALRQVQMMMLPLDPIFSSSLQLLVTDLLVLLLHEKS